MDAITTYKFVNLFAKATPESIPKTTIVSTSGLFKNLAKYHIHIATSKNETVSGVIPDPNLSVGENINNPAQAKNTKIIDLVITRTAFKNIHTPKENNPPNNIRR
jgi:hypothetical protein